MLSLPELELVVKSIHQREHRANRFAASLKGIDIDNPKSSGNGGEEGTSKFEEIKRRAQAKLQGKTEEEMEADDLRSLGINIMIDED